MASAVNGCKSGTGADTVEVRNLSGVLTLRSPLEVTDGFITIVGSPTSGLTISGGRKTGILRVSPDATLVLQQLSFQDGSAPQGGVIFNNAGEIFISDVEFNSNRATGSNGSGGAIYNFHGNVTMVNAFLRFNAAVTGGAIENLGAMRIFHSGVGINNADNGGGIANIGGSLRISRVSVSSNSISNSSGQGGGLYIDGGEVSLTDSTITGNKGSGSSDKGGGAYVVKGALNVLRCAFVANTAAGEGGGIANDNGDVNIINSTFWSNDSKTNGGAIYNQQGQLTVTASTIANGQGGGGIVGTQQSSSRVRGTIVAENTDGNCKRVTNAGYNISNDDTCGFGNRTRANGLTIGDNVDPKLTNLGFNGGPTQTVPLGTGSPAIGAIPLTDCTGQVQPKAPITTDQRSFGRPSPDHPNSCDIGAFEAGALPPS